MKKLLIFATALLFVFSCTNNQKPVDVEVDSDTDCLPRTFYDCEFGKSTIDDVLKSLDGQGYKYVYDESLGQIEMMPEEPEERDGGYFNIIRFMFVDQVLSIVEYERTIYYGEAMDMLEEEYWMLNDAVKEKYGKFASFDKSLEDAADWSNEYVYCDDNTMVTVRTEFYDVEVDFDEEENVETGKLSLTFMDCNAMDV